MTTITPQQSRQRFKILSDSLQNLIFSEQTAEIIRRVGEENHLSEEKLGKVAEAVGTVLLGFIHPDELASVIRDAVGVDLVLAKELSSSFNTRIFAPVKSELEASYAPVGETPSPLPSPSPNTSAPKPFGGQAAPPKIIEEIKKPVPMPSTSVPRPNPIPGGQIAPSPKPPTPLSGAPLIGGAAPASLGSINPIPPPPPKAPTGNFISGAIPPMPSAPELKQAGSKPMPPPAPAFLSKSSVEPIKPNASLSELSRKMGASQSAQPTPSRFDSPRPGSVQGGSSFGGAVSAAPPKPAQVYMATPGVVGVALPPRPLSPQGNLQGVTPNNSARPGQVGAPPPTGELHVVHYGQWKTNPPSPSQLSEGKLGGQATPTIIKSSPTTSIPVPLSELTARAKTSTPEAASSRVLGALPSLFKNQNPPSGAASVMAKSAPPPLPPHQVAISPPLGPHVQNPTISLPPTPPSPAKTLSGSLGGQATLPPPPVR